MRLIIILCLLFASPSQAFEWSAFSPLLDSQSWDYSPSWMADSVLGYDRIWWCSDRYGAGIPAEEGDVIKYRSNIQPSPQVVLLPNMGGWEGPCVCDPAVVRGNFTMEGKQFNQAMYYTASPTCSTDNKVGVAFSNDGINWQKYSGNPIISSAGRGGCAPDENCLSTYGAGQAQVRNWDGQAGIELWYTDTEGAQGAGIYERSSSDGINFGVAKKLSLEGIDCAPGCIGGQGVALSPTSPYELYLLIGRNGNLVLYKIPFDQRFTGTWSLMDEFTPSEAGYGAIFEGGFRTDIYGNLFSASWPTIWAGFGAGPCYIDTPNCDTTQWSLGQAGGN
ncbi:MAG: hypothetical protein ACPW60_11525 [Methylohalobius sp. ZOD2]